MFGAIRAVAYSHKVRKILKRDYNLWLYGGAPVGSAAFDAFSKLSFIGWSTNTPAEKTAVLYALACNSLNRQPLDYKECADALGKEGYHELAVTLGWFNLIVAAGA
jgi:hypothetical protein